jgi:Phage portal protein
LIGEDGRAPEPPDPAYQQILKGIPAADFSAEELLYLPRNLRAHRLYGFSPVEQIALTVNIALRRDASTLDYYRAGSSPDAFATLPKEWTADQIRSFQDYFDALMSGNLARRRQTKFMPADFKLIEARQPPLKDQYDEWLARIICYAFSVPVSPFVSQVNRATSETLRQQAAQEGLVPLKAWVKNALDHVIQNCMNEPGLELVWVGDDAIDPLEQAQTLQILVGAGIKTREEARADLGLGPAGGKGPVADDTASKVLRKFNPHHDERGQFATADGAVATVGSPARKPQPTAVQVASLDRVMSDATVDGGTADQAALQTADSRQTPASVTPDAQTDSASLPVRQARERVVATAEKYVGSMQWSNDVAIGRYRVGSNKCNLFVYDALTEAGASPGRPHGVWPITSYAPVAADWANPDFVIPGWRVLGAGGGIAGRGCYCTTNRLQ